MQNNVKVHAQAPCSALKGVILYVLKVDICIVMYCMFEFRAFGLF